MAKTNAANERIKRDYFTFLRDAQGRDEATIDGIAKSLARFEQATGAKDFGRFHRQQAVNFKAKLSQTANARTGERLSKATILATLRDLRALKALLPMYAGKVDCVFIDPPYNTGNEGWSYNDNVNSPMIREWLNSNPVGIEDGLRHDKWCAMMWPRLKLLWELLSDTGSLFVICDDNEANNLGEMLREICNERAYVSTIVWQKVFAKKNKALVSGSHDTIYVYSKDGLNWDRNLLPRTEDQEAGFSNPDNDPRGDWQSVSFSVQSEDSDRRAAYRYKVQLPSGREVGPPPGRHWNGLVDRYETLKAEGRIWFGQAGNSRPRIKVFLCEVQSGIVPDTWWSHTEFGNNQEAKRELNEIFGTGDIFKTPKPLRLLQGIISIATKEDSIILDSFAGSGTTAHAVLNANRKDRGCRRFILVECENYADTVTAERMRRVINGYDFQGIQRSELLRESLNWRVLNKSGALVEKVEAIENLHGHEYDRIRKEVKDSELIVTGEKAVAERTEGVGGAFTYCTLGDPVEMDAILSGGALPAAAAMAGLLWHTATAMPLEAGSVEEVPQIGDGVTRLGTFGGRTFWMIYRPDLGWLKSGDAALSLAKARTMAATATGNHLVFAPAKFVSRELLAREKIDLDYAPLPFALYRLETA